MDVSYEIEVKTLAKHAIAAVKFRGSIAELPQHMGAAFGDAMGYLMRNGIQPEGPAVAMYTPVTDGVFDVAAGFLVAAAIEGDGHVVPAELPAGEVATTLHVGSYESLTAAYAAVQAWMQREGREAGETMWEEYLSGPEVPPEETRTIVYWPLKPR
jgi:effector-binding domain-containing protein